MERFTKPAWITLFMVLMILSSVGFINDTSSSMESLSSILKYEKMSCDSDIFQSEDVVADLGLDQRGKGNKTRWCCCRRCCGYAVNCRRIPGCPSC
jgi:hypothetical protein